MKEVIDGLLHKHHGEKEVLKAVDKEYADIVRRSPMNPNSLLHPTTKHHISWYVKHLAKVLNTSSLLNTSPEKLAEIQELRHTLTEGSQSTSVSVTPIELAVFNPPAPALSTPITQDPLEKTVEGILNKQQQQQPEQKKRQTKTCFSCGQPKSRYETDGSSIHFFFQQGPVRYFYCSKKVHDTYVAEGLSNPNMSFEEFSTTTFFQRQLQEIKKLVEEKTEKKRNRTES
ncbi:hypothetical protein CHARACLAT_031967 [Characodon lateralis]|uniref:Uncharacterized protein n=1 Tax=Characodon lateralis TaxID=208331 RepID=A0ABU7E859_9TELE|nr:hypothetical protein [Characodon lateralis]